MPPSAVERQVLGPRAEDHRLAVAAAGVGRRLELRAVGQFDARRAAAAAQRAGQEVHRRRADEAGDEQVGRVVVELQRAAGLLDAAVAA